MVQTLFAFGGELRLEHHFDRFGFEQFAVVGEDAALDFEEVGEGCLRTMAAEAIFVVCVQERWSPGY